MDTPGVRCLSTWCQACFQGEPSYMSRGNAYLPGQPCHSFPLLPDAQCPGGLQDLETDAASCHGEALRSNRLFRFSLFLHFNRAHIWLYKWQFLMCSNPLPWCPPDLGCSLEEGPLLCLFCSVLPGVCGPSYWLLLLIPMISLCLFIQKVYRLHLSIPLGPAKSSLPAARQGCCCCSPW